MSRFLLTFCGVAWWAATAASALAQDADTAPPPSAPFVNAAPDYEAWTVTYTADKPDQPAAANPMMAARAQRATLQEVRVKKMKTSRQDLQSWSDGSTSEIWNLAGLTLYQPPGNSYVYTLTQTGRMMGNWGDFLPDYTHGDFPEFGWISLQNYVGVAHYHGEVCYHFQVKNPPAPAPPKTKTRPHPHRWTSAPVSTEAWIDIGTKLPVGFDDGVSLRIYAFRSLPEESSDIPPAFLREWKRYRMHQAN